MFENELADRCRAIGVDLRDGSPVQDVELGAGDADHRITFGAEGDEQEAAARWIVGATGRAAFMKRKLGLAQDVEHTINASWLRLQNGLELDAWSDDEAWQGRMQQQKVRWLYTNHLMGEGYWVWLIPLGTGAISIGIVADPRFHPFERISTLEAALDWLDEHEPLVAEAVRSRPDDVQDFLRVEDYAYQVERVYSPERWCLTGDAGAFTDPFYSPGSDFIALGNTCITDLVVRDLAGEPVEERVERFNDQFLQQFRRQLDFYTDMYELWGNPQVMCAKVSWDLLVYWGLTSVRYVHGFWHDLDFSAETSELLDRAYELNERIQRFFREWHAIDDREAEDAYIALIPFAAVGFRRLDLERPLDRDGLKALLAENVGRMEGMAVAMFHKACTRLPDASAVEGASGQPLRDRARRRPLGGGRPLRRDGPDPGAGARARRGDPIDLARRARRRAAADLREAAVLAPPTRERARLAVFATDPEVDGPAILRWRCQVVGLDHFGHDATVPRGPRAIGTRSCPHTARCRATHPLASPSTFRTSSRSSRLPPVAAVTQRPGSLPTSALRS